MNLVTEHRLMVADLVKPPKNILESLTLDGIDLWHAVTGISGEAGELLDAVKKHVVYNTPLDLDNMIEELGDLEFYMEQMRQALKISREATLIANVEKLRRKRYPNGYSDEAAQARADKTGE